MPTPSRRDLLAAGAALPLAGAARATPTTPTPPLQSLAAQKGMRFGACFAAPAPSRPDRGTYDNPAYAALLTGECGLLVPENEMKWQWLRPSPTAFRFAPFDAMMAWADRHHLAVRGHNLLWHQPKWMPRWEEAYDFGATPRAAGERLLVTHIETVMRRYAGRIREWDVVNETVDEHSGALHQTALSRAIGGTEPTLDLAFHTARITAPAAELVYNDYMSWEPGNENHRAGVLRLLEGFRKRGTPVDALGVQSHIITQAPDATGGFAAYQAEWRRFLDAVTAMGYRLVVTELDVRDDHLPADPAVRDRAVADVTRAYLDVTLGYPQLRDVLAWGLCDRFSWIQGFSPRPDGAARRPCPYDAAFRAKPMRDAIAQALASTRPR